jgi:hypothetical protein
MDVYVQDSVRFSEFTALSAIEVPTDVPLDIDVLVVWEEMNYSGYGRTEPLAPGQETAVQIILNPENSPPGEPTPPDPEDPTTRV